MHLAEMAEGTREKKKQKNDGAGKDYADKSFGKNAESDEGGDAPAGKKRGLFGLPAVEEEIEGESDPQADGDVWDENAREEVRTAGSQKDDGGPETGLRGEKATAKEKKKESYRQDAKVKKEASAPGVGAEKRHTRGHAPIREGSLFEVADAVFVQGHPVVAEEDVAAGVGVGSVHIVLKGRSEKSGTVDGEPKEKKNGERSPSTRSCRWSHSSGEPRKA
jgi:hypothetical protein